MPMSKAAESESPDFSSVQSLLKLSIPVHIQLLKLAAGVERRLQIYPPFPPFLRVSRILGLLIPDISQRMMDFA